MTLRLKSAIVVSCSIALGVVSLWLFLRQMTLMTYARLEERRALEEVRGVVSLVRDDLDRLAAEAARAAARAASPPAASGGDADFSVVARADGSPVWGSPAPDAVPSGVLRELADLAGQPGGAPGPGAVTGVLGLPGGPALVAARALGPAGPAGARGGVAVAGRWIGDAWTARARRVTLLEVDASPADSARLAGGLRAARGQLSAASPYLALPIDDHRMGGYALLADLRGRPALLLAVETPRDLAEEGRITLRYLLLGLVVVGVAIVGVAIAVLERFVLSRVRRLAGEVARIGPETGFTGSVRISGADEMAALGGVINGTLAALQAARRDLQESNAGLERKVEERTAELARLEAFKEEVIRGMASGLVAFRPDGTVTLANPAARRTLGLPGEGGLTGGLADAVGAPFAALLLDALRDGEVAGEPREARVALPDGRERLLGYTVSRTGPGEGAQGIALFRDLTEAKRLEEEMARLDRLASLGEVAAQLAHELRNPLTAMYSTMQLLARGLDGEPARMGGVILENMERMEEIIRRMRLLSREAPLARARLDLRELLDRLLDFLAATGERGGIALRRPPPGDPVWIDGDAAQLSQALLNLLMNAVQATPRGGAVAVALGPAPGGAPAVAVSVADTGPGIPPALASRVLDPFFTTKEQGTGLGLPIALRIVRAHGGTMRFEPRPGGGTVFTVELPLGA